MSLNINHELNDFYLTTKEMADVFGVTFQAIGKMCNELGLKTQYGKKIKLYPDVVNTLYRNRGGGAFKKSTITFHSIKGGPGKTTLSHLMSTRISSYGYKVLAIDLDKQANLTNAFGLDDESDEYDLHTMYDLYLSKKTKRGKKVCHDDVIVEITDFLHLIPANIDLANLDLALSNDTINYQLLMKKMLEGVCENYDIIIIDLPPDNNRVTIASHCFADLVFMPINMAKFSIKGLRTTMAHIDVVESDFSHPLRRMIVPNKMDLREKSSFDILSAINNKYSEQMSPAIIPVSRALEDSYLRGVCPWNVTRAKSALQAVDTIVRTELCIDEWRKLSPKRRNRRTNKGEVNLCQS